MGNITVQQKKFADLFISTGNAKQSYIDAGYKARNNVAEANASRLLRNAKVKEYIKQRNAQLEQPRIADMTEVKEFWSKLLRNDEADFRDRLKASEYIAKTNAAFIENIRNEHSGGIKINLEGEVKEWAK
jgi:phage terminase small subunit